jgi:oligopeptidase B
MAVCNLVVTHPDWIQAAILKVSGRSLATSTPYASLPVAQVPFVDVLTTMLDASLPLTLHEADEWGNPDQDQGRFMVDKLAYGQVYWVWGGHSSLVAAPAAFDLLSSYCPYSNIQKAAYPSMLVTACMHDNQVKYWQPAKFVAKVREL